MIETVPETITYCTGIVFGRRLCIPCPTMCGTVPTSYFGCFDSVCKCQTRSIFFDVPDEPAEGKCRKGGPGKSYQDRCLALATHTNLPSPTPRCGRVLIVQHITTMVNRLEKWLNKHSRPALTRTYPFVSQTKLFLGNLATNIYYYVVFCISICSIYRGNESLVGVI